MVHNRKVKGAPRGAVVKALAICSRHRFLHVFQPFLNMALDRLYLCDERAGTEGTADNLECLKELYTQLNSLELSDMPFITWVNNNKKKIKIA